MQIPFKKQARNLEEKTVQTIKVITIYEFQYIASSYNTFSVTNIVRGMHSHKYYLALNFGNAKIMQNYLHGSFDS